MSYRASSVGMKPSGQAVRAGIRARLRAQMQSLGAATSLAAMKPSGQATRASIRARQLRAGYKAQGLLGLLGLGTDIMSSPTTDSSIQMTTDPNAYINQGSSSPQPVNTSTPLMTAVPVTTTAPSSISITATVPTQMPDGSMGPTQLIPTQSAPATSGQKKGFLSFLETTKADGTVTGPLGVSWTVWLVGGGAAALYFANRHQSDGGYEEPAEEAPVEASTPNARRRRRRSR